MNIKFPKLCLHRVVCDRAQLPGHDGQVRRVPQPPLHQPLRDPGEAPDHLLEAGHLTLHPHHLGPEAGRARLSGPVTQVAEDKLVREVSELLPQPGGVVRVRIGEEGPGHHVLPEHRVRGDDGQPPLQALPPQLDEVARDPDNVGHQLSGGQAGNQAIRKPAQSI